MRLQRSPKEQERLNRDKVRRRAARKAAEEKRRAELDELVKNAPLRLQEVALEELAAWGKRFKRKGRVESSGSVIKEESG